MSRSECGVQTVTTGKSRNTLSCIPKCVTPCLTRRRLIGLRGIEGWQVSDGLLGIYSVYYVLCLCACVLAEVRDTGQRGDTSGWHPVKASWQHVVILPSGSHTPLRSQISTFARFLVHMWAPFKSIEKEIESHVHPQKWLVTCELLDPRYDESKWNRCLRCSCIFDRNRKWHQYICSPCLCI